MGATRSREPSDRAYRAAALVVARILAQLADRGAPELAAAA